MPAKPASHGIGDIRPSPPTSSRQRHPLTRLDNPWVATQQSQPVSPGLFPRASPPATQLQTAWAS
eukprot:5859171-Amphidinium_carterae.1